MPAEMPPRFQPGTIETKWYEFWTDHELFKAVRDIRKKPFSIMIPPPNVTGVLHMGHALNNTLQDIVARFKRMQGFCVLWLPGTDHAGIATQAVVEKKLLAEQKVTRNELGREQFLEEVWKWKDEYGNRILNQLKKLGASCDWSRTRFTMDEGLTRAVRESFVKLWHKGLVYRGYRMINWDCKLQTAISDDEIETTETRGHLWYIRYPIKDQPEKFVVVATTRPETMLGDTAVAVHPDPAAALAAEVQKAEAALERASDKERAGAEEALEALRARQRDMLPRLVQLAEMARDGRKVRLPMMER